MSRHHLNRGVMWGRLLESLLQAKEALYEARAQSQLLDLLARDLIAEVHERVIGLEQRAWELQALESERAGAPRGIEPTRTGRRR